MTYRGFTARVERDAKADLYHGEVADIDDVVTFQAESDGALEREFHAAVDDYLAFCAENGIEPHGPSTSA